MLCLSGGVDYEKFSDAWKRVASRSERQLGAFVFVFLREFGEPPDILGNKLTKLRNDVVHNGKIPSRGEALKFGDNVLSIVRPKIALLKSEHSDTVRQVVAQSLSDKGHKISDEASRSTLVIPTILSLENYAEDHHTRSLEQAISELMF